jgi:integration host factor subunit beta
MTRNDLVAIIAEAGDMTARDAQGVFESILDGMAESLARGEKVELRGFGSFRIRERGPRTGRNPKTGESVEVPAKRIPHFKPGKELRDRVNSALARENDDPSADGGALSHGSHGASGHEGDDTPPQSGVLPGFDPNT